MSNCTRQNRTRRRPSPPQDFLSLPYSPLQFFHFHLCQSVFLFCFFFEWRQKEVVTVKLCVWSGFLWHSIERERKEKEDKLLSNRLSKINWLSLTVTDTQQKVVLDLFQLLDYRFCFAFFFCPFLYQMPFRNSIGFYLLGLIFLFFLKRVLNLFFSFRLFFCFWLPAAGGWPE